MLEEPIRLAAKWRKRRQKTKEQVGKGAKEGRRKKKTFLDLSGGDVGGEKKWEGGV